MGHVHEDMMRMTAKKCGIKLTGKLQNFLNCSLEKSKRKKIIKKDHKHSETKGERIHTDIIYTKQESINGYKFWMLTVDQNTKFKWKSFLKRKSDLSNKLIEVIKRLEVMETEFLILYVIILVKTHLLRMIISKTT